MKDKGHARERKCQNLPENKGQDMSQFHCIPYKRNFLYNLNDLIKIELTPAHWKKCA